MGIETGNMDSKAMVVYTEMSSPPVTLLFVLWVGIWVCHLSIHRLTDHMHAQRNQRTKATFKRISRKLEKMKKHIKKLVETNQKHIKKLVETNHMTNHMQYEHFNQLIDHVRADILEQISAN